MTAGLSLPIMYLKALQPFEASKEWVLMGEKRGTCVPAGINLVQIGCFSVISSEPH